MRAGVDGADEVVDATGLGGRVEQDRGNGRRAPLFMPRISGWF